MSSQDNPRRGHLTRRHFVARTSLGITALAGACRVDPRDLLPNRDLLPGDGLELLVTNSPVSEFENRRVEDRAVLKFSRLREWQSFALNDGDTNHEFLVQARHDGLFLEFELKLVLHGKLRRHMVMRNRSDLMVHKLWLSRAYTHGDSGRACFPAPQQQAPFEGDLWFATFYHGEPRVQAESRQSFEYGRSRQGRVRLNLPGNHRYALDWEAHRDGRGRNYRTSWFRGNQLLFDTVESVFHINEAAGCQPLRMASYCDTDDI